MSKSFREYAIERSIDSGKSVRAIGRELQVPESTLRGWFKAYKETGQTSKRAPPGRPRKLSGAANTYLGKLACANRTASASRIATKINHKKRISVTAQTVRNTLKRLGYKKKKPSKKPFLRKIDMIRRKRWAIDNRSRKWQDVIFSDEATFQLYRNTLLYWTKGNERIIKPTKAHGPKLNVWAGIYRTYKFPLFIFKENMNAALYQRILKSSLLPNLKNIRNSGAFFQMDNDPKHRANSTQKFLADKNIKVLPWPSYAPELNPMENVWHVLKSRVEARNPTTEEELRAAIEAEWSQVPIENLVASMPDRIEAVIEANGAQIKY